MKKRKPNVRNPKAKPLSVKEIRKMRKTLSVAKIAERLHVTRQAIYQKLWREGSSNGSVAR
jgi:DNA-binding transcriptional regulator YiaG